MSNTENVKTTAERVVAIVADKSGEKIEAVKLDRMINDLGFDSLDAVELCMEVEREFNIALSDDEMEKLTNVQSIVNQVEKSLAAQALAK